MENNSKITYSVTKIKYSEITSEESFESQFEALSTNISSQSFLLPHLALSPDFDFSSEIFGFPLTKPFSKSLQKKISKASPESLSTILKQLTPYLPSLMVDLYGNYVCQTIFHSCSADQRYFILETLKGHLLKISYSPRGTHALQNLISLSSSKKEENLFIEEFKGKYFL